MNKWGTACVLGLVLASCGPSGNSQATIGGPRVVGDVIKTHDGQPVPPIACTITNKDGNRIDEAFAVDPSDSNTLYVAVEYHGVYKSTDGGKTWKESDNGILGYGRRSDPNKPCIQEIGKMIIDPTNHNHLLLGRTDTGTVSDFFGETAGVWETLDGGQNWHQATKPGINTDVAQGMAFDPKDGKTWYIGITNIPSDLAGPNAPLPQKVGIVYKTSDDGANWQELPTGISGRAGVEHIFVNPSSPNQVIVFTEDQPLHSQYFTDPLGILLSNDAGATWQRLPATGFPGPAFDSDASKSLNHLFAIPYETATQNASYYSLDGGQTFHAAGGAASGLTKARFDPFDPQELKMLAVDNVGHCLSSNNAGASWISIGSSLPPGPNESLPRVSDIVWDVQNENIVYAVGVYRSDAPNVPFIDRSTDGGAHWTSILDPSQLA